MATVTVTTRSILSGASTINVLAPSIISTDVVRSGAIGVASNHAAEDHQAGDADNNDTLQSILPTEANADTGAGIRSEGSAQDDAHPTILTTTTTTTTTGTGTCSI